MALAEFRRNKYLTYFRENDVQWTVNEMNFQEEDEGGSINMKNDLEVTSGKPTEDSNKGNNNKESSSATLLIPNRRPPQSTRIANSCAICLGSYECGEDVVWSTNKECEHCYHADCILDYFVTLLGTDDDELEMESPCPCCRRAFCTFKKKTSDDDNEKDASDRKSRGGENQD